MLRILAAVWLLALALGVGALPCIRAQLRPGGGVLQASRSGQPVSGPYRARPPARAAAARPDERAAPRG